MQAVFKTATPYPDEVMMNDFSDPMRAILDDVDALTARQLLEDVLHGRIIGVLALVSYTNGRVDCIRMGTTPSALDI